MFSKDSLYFRQVELIVKVAPFVANETDFALKGGTAINLFVQDMPRLSVDIDLIYLPVKERAVSLAAISETLERIADDVEKKLRGSRKNIDHLLKYSNLMCRSKLYIETKSRAV